MSLDLYLSVINRSLVAAVSAVMFLGDNYIETFYYILSTYLFLLHRGIEGVCRTLLGANVTRTLGVERIVNFCVPGVLGEVRGDVEVTLALVPGSRMSEGKKTDMKSLTLQCTGFPVLEMK